MESWVNGLSGAVVVLALLVLFVRCLWPVSGTSAAAVKNVTRAEISILPRTFAERAYHLIFVCYDSSVARHLHPDIFSFFGLGFCLAAGIALGSLHFGIASLALALGGLGDILDGLAARKRPEVRRSGILLDTVLDRYSEFFLFLGCSYCFGENVLWQGCVLFALFGSLMVTYTSAQSNIFNLPIPHGWMKRFDRVALLELGLVAAFLNSSSVFPVTLRSEDPLAAIKVAVVLIAVGSNVSAIARSLYLYDRLGKH